MRIWREVRHFAWHWWFSLQRCCKTFCFNSVVQNVCVCTLLTSCLGAKIHYYYMWPLAKKLYHGWISTMTSSYEISWKLPPPKWRAGCAPVPWSFCFKIFFQVYCTYFARHPKLELLRTTSQMQLTFIQIQPHNTAQGCMFLPTFLIYFGNHSRFHGNHTDNWSRLDRCYISHLMAGNQAIKPKSSGDMKHG